MADRTLVLASATKWLVVVSRPTVSAAGITALVGPSNYQLAVQQGYSGTLAQWLDSLKGEDAYQLAVDDGFTGTRTEWLASLVGPANELTFTAATGAPGTDVAVVVTGASPHQQVALTIPRGDPGIAATVEAVSTATGAPGSDAAVTNIGTASAARLEFVVPRGDKGDPGDPGAAGVVQAIVQGSGIAVDNSDPAHPVVSATNAGTVTAVAPGSGISVDASDPAQPTVSLDAQSKDLTDVSDTAPSDGQVRHWDAGLALWVPGPAGIVQAIVPGTNVSVDNADPTHPVVSASGGGGSGTVQSVVPGTGIAVDASDPANPVVSSTTGGPQVAARLSAVVSTASIAAGASDNVQVAMATSYRLLSVQTDRPARVRIYESAAARTADAARAVGTDPGADSGLILEYVTTDTNVHPLSPVVAGASLESTPSAYAQIAVTNNGTTGPVTVTLAWEPATGVSDRPTMALFKTDGALATGVGTTRYPNITGAPWRIAAVIANVETAPSGGTVVVDVNIDGVSIFTNQANRPTIAAGATSSGKVTTMDVTTIPDGSNVTVDIDTTTAPAANLTVALLLADGSVVAKPSLATRLVYPFTRTYTADQLDGIIGWLGTGGGLQPYRNPVNAGMTDPLSPSGFVITDPVVTTSSSTFAPSFLPSKAFDHNLAGNDGEFHSGNNPSEWWMVDFGSHTITPTRIAIWGRTNGGQEPRNFALQGSNDGTNFTTLLSVTNAGPNDNGVWSSAITGAAAYRYLRIVATGLNGNSQYFLMLAEVEFWGTVA